MKIKIGDFYMKLSNDELLVKIQKTIEDCFYEDIQKIKYNLTCLDEYDFSDYFSEGRSLLNILENIEEDYDKEFKEKFGFYMFDDLDIDLIKEYFKNRYNIEFQEYVDWVVRKKWKTYN